VQELTDWVQYTNFEGESPMSILRRENGREKPWQVNFWGVGNEAWGCGGNMTPEYYTQIYRQYATFMRSKNIFRIASGANSDDYNWTEVLMRDIPHWMLQGVALHHYSVIDWDKKGSATEFSEQQYFQIIRNAWKMEELVTKHSTIMDKYDPQKKIALVVDEWGGWYEVETGTNPSFLYQQNTMRDAILAGITLNVFNNHSDRVRMANLAQTVNVLQSVILTNEERMILTPTYHVMQLYVAHHDSKLLPVSVKSGEYVFGTEKLPAMHASASLDANNVTHISLVNIDAKNAQPVTIDFGDTRFKSASAMILTSTKVQDFNSFEQPEKIKPMPFKNIKINGATVDVTLPPFSVTVIELKQ
jgi:alpha-N-arabinofuranosidase